MSDFVLRIKLPEGHGVDEFKTDPYLIPRVLSNTAARITSHENDRAVVDPQTGQVIGGWQITDQPDSFPSSFRAAPEVYSFSDDEMRFICDALLHLIDSSKDLELEMHNKSTAATRATAPVFRAAREQFVETQKAALALLQRLA